MNPTSTAFHQTTDADNMATFAGDLVYHEIVRDQRTATAMKLWPSLAPSLSSPETSGDAS